MWLRTNIYVADFTDEVQIYFLSASRLQAKKMLQMIHSLHLHRLKTDHADNKLVCNLSVLGKTDLLQICCRSAGFVRATTTVKHYDYTTLLMYNTTTVQHYYCAILPLYSTTTVQHYNCTALQMHNTTTVQHYNSTSQQMYNSVTEQYYNTLTVHH